MEAFLQYTSNIKINWFDLVVIGVLVTGLLQGRKLGMSHLLIQVLQWLTVVVLAAFAYKPIAEMLITWAKIPMIVSYLICYVWVAAFVILVFRYIKDKTKGQLVSGDFFGSMEYYFGMMGGVLKMFCILIFCMSLLHSRQYTPQEIQRNALFQKEWFGSVRFPTLGEVHRAVFKESTFGKYVALYLPGQLIVPTNPKQRSPSRTMAQSREDEVDAVIMGFGNAR